MARNRGKLREHNVVLLPHTDWDKNRNILGHVREKSHINDLNPCKTKKSSGDIFSFHMNTMFLTN